MVDTLTSGEVVTIRSATAGMLASEVSTRPKVSCVLTGRVTSAPVASGTGTWGRGRTGRFVSSPPVRAHARSSGDPSGNRSHSVSRSSPDRGAQIRDLVGGEQCGVVQRIAGHRETPPLDRVGEHDARAIGHLIARPVRVEQHPEVVAAEVGDDPFELVVVVRRDERRQTGVRAVEEPGAQFGSVHGEQALVPLVLHRVDVGAQKAAAVAGAGFVHEPAVLRLDHVPPGPVEELDQLLDLLVGDHTIEALAIDVDHPHHRPQTLQGRVGDRFPDVALVEFGVADERDEPGRIRRGGGALEMRVDVPAGHGGEQRRHRAEPDRAGGEVGHVRILRPAGVGLQTADLAQPREVRPVEFAREVLDRVVHRAGVRLHRHLVVAAEMAEPQRGHDRHHRGRRRLMAADLDRHVARRRHPLPIGVVDHAHREPEHPSLDPIERVQITGVTVDGHRPIMPALGARDGPTRSRRTWTATTVR